MENQKSQFKIKKLLPIILAVVLVGVLIGGGVWLMQKKSEPAKQNITKTEEKTSELKTFSDKEMGFSFDYSPDQFKMGGGNLYNPNLEVQSTTKKIYISPDVPGSSNKIGPASFWIGRQGIRQDYTNVYDYIKSENVSDCEDKKINNINWVECKYSGVMGAPRINLFVLNNGKIYVVGFPEFRSGYENFDAIGSDMYKILETFQFIN